MTVTLRIEDTHTAWVTIDRPDALNAVSFEVMEALEAALDAIESDDDLRVVVLHGANGAFISGGDLKQFASLDTDADIRAMSLRMKAVLSRFEALDCWTIACIEGDAYGGGCETLLAMDIRVAHTSSRFGFTQAKFSVTPGWGGLTRLVEAVGAGTAKYWLATAAIVDAEDALRRGLCHRVVDNPVSEVGQLTARLGKQDKTLIRAMKSGVRRACAGREASMDAELEGFVETWLSSAHAESIERFLKRDRLSPSS